MRRRTSWCSSRAGGTNLQALLDAEHRGEIPNGQITCVISSKADAYALERAKQNGIKTRVLARSDYADIAAYSAAMVKALKEEQADLVIYAGFMTILDEQVVRAFPNKMMNVHPALIPSFCGKGFYGLHVHEEVLKRGVKLTGRNGTFCDGSVRRRADHFAKRRPRFTGRHTRNFAAPRDGAVRMEAAAQSRRAVL